MSAKDIPIIPDEDAHFAESVMRAQMRGEPHPLTGSPISRDQANNARELIKLYQTQQRFAPEKIDKMLRQSPSENVRNLAALTPDELERKRAAMTADFPGKTKPA